MEISKQLANKIMDDGEFLGKSPAVKDCFFVAYAFNEKYFVGLNFDAETFREVPLDELPSYDVHKEV